MMQGPRDAQGSNPSKLQEAKSCEVVAAARKLIIQIPCLNERDALPVALADLPREVNGFHTVEWLIIDDGSTDGTAEVAALLGADHVLRFDKHYGLAKAYAAGLEAALRLGADVIVNTDADNQYSAESIPDLVAPILNRRAQIVVGARPISDIEHFSFLKKLLQKLGTWVVRVASGTKIEDATSGFRAVDRDAAAMLIVFNNYTYTLETIIQAGRRGIPIVSVPIRVNAFLRPSRLISSIPRYVFRSIVTITRIFITYKPARFFGALSAVTLLPGLIAIARFLIFYATGNGLGHVQSLVLGTGLVATSAVLMMAGVLADLVSVNRRLLEDIRFRQIRQDLDSVRRPKNG